MSQLPIREYDAKRLWSAFSGTTYRGVLIVQESQIDQIVPVLERMVKGGLWVVKPDQLFGKRGKYGLVGVKLDAQGVKDRLVAHWAKSCNIGGVVDLLDTFLIEPFVPHEEEYYLSLSTEREYDLIRFSARGGMGIEEHRESVFELKVGVLEELQDEQLVALLNTDHHGDKAKTNDSFVMTGELRKFLKQFFQFFRQYGFTSLEVNPFVVSSKQDSFQNTEGEIFCLDMVAKIDSCELYRQKERKSNISRVKPFGTLLHPSETLVESLDEKTGASLKLTIINPQGRLRFLLGGGGASVVAMDALAERNLLAEVANYGELSGNPDEESNRAYVTTLIETMLANGKSDQYLCLIGGIANFTDIVSLVKPLCEVLEKYAAVCRERNITVMMRRGGLRVEQAMHLLATTCADYGIACKIYDDEHYLTKVFDEVKL